MDTLAEITSENPVPRNAPSSDETPPPKQTTPEQTNETTIPSTESSLQSAASNDDENEIEMFTMSNKRTVNEDSFERDTTKPLPAKKAATSSPASEQSGTRVTKGRGGGDLSMHFYVKTRVPALAIQHIMPCMNSTEPLEIYMLPGKIKEEAWPDP